MRPVNDGKTRAGRLTIVRTLAAKTASGYSLIECRCDCGALCLTSSRHLWIWADRAACQQCRAVCQICGVPVPVGRRTLCGSTRCRAMYQARKTRIYAARQAEINPTEWAAHQRTLMRGDPQKHEVRLAARREKRATQQSAASPEEQARARARRLQYKRRRAEVAILLDIRNLTDV